MAKSAVPELKVDITSWPPDSKFRLEWATLLETVTDCSPFDHLEWIEIGIACYGEGERILPCRFLDNDGTLGAMGIFRVTQEQGKLFTRTVVRTVDYNSQRINPIVGAEDAETMVAAFKALTTAIEIPIDSFDFFKLDPKEGVLEQASRLLTDEGLPHILETFNEQPYFPLEGTWKEYLSERTQGHRKRIRRYTRKLWERYPDYTFRRYRSVEDFGEVDLAAVLQESMRLFDKSWQAETLSEYDALDDLKVFYGKVAQAFLSKGMLDLCTLHCDNTIIAFELNLYLKGSVYMLFGAYDRDYADWSPGNAILSEILQDSYRRQYRRVEFGGEYVEYKRLWTKHATRSYHLRIHGNTIKAKIKKVINR